jgi:ribonuclease R
MSPTTKINKDYIYHYLKTKTSRPVSLKEISKSLNIKGAGLRSLKIVLRKLTRGGEIFRTKSGFYGLAAKMNLIKGLFEAHKDGYGFVVPEVSGEKDIFVPPRRTLGAMTGDRVVARIESPVRMEGTIVTILERGQQKIIGRLCREDHSFFVKPKGRNIPFFILISPDNLGEAKKDDMVSVEIITYPTSSTPPEGKILKVLPDVVEPRLETEMIIEEYALPRKFPAPVVSEVKAITKSSNYRSRVDCRDLLTVTIDGETAKDFDDAISISKTDEGFLLHVHIADVSHYVPWDSPLDLEARKRGTSVYFPGSVIPMLPEKLSNNLCSLVPGEDRLVMTAEMHIDKSGTITKKSFYSAVIKSDERMTYTSVKKILTDRDPDERKRYDRLIGSFETMNELCAILRRERISRGSLDFDLPEPEILLDIEGRPDAIMKSERNIAHMIIEEFMIAANEAVASHLEASGLPSIYRVHEKPDIAKLDELRPVFNSFGFKTGKAGPKTFASIIEQVKGTPEEQFLHILLLRSLKQAKYFTENIGHFGLASKCYTHFTSPIRRYPDLIIHRILKESISAKKPSQKKIELYEKLFSEISASSSTTERRAEEAEREIVSAMKTWFMKDKVGNEYEGIISKITPHGLRIQLKEFFVEGLLHVSSMTDDYYIFNEKNFSLTGRRNKKSFTIGMDVRIIVEKVDTEEREILFKLV